MCFYIISICVYIYARSITNIHCIEYTLTYTHMCSVCTTCINIYIYTVRTNHLETIFEGPETTPKMLVLKGAASKKDAIVQGYKAK